MRTLILISMLATALLAPYWAAAASPAASLTTGTAEKGWFWYEDPPKPVKPPKPVAPVAQKQVAPAITSASKPEEAKKDPCRARDTWEADKCGFVDPGKDFAWQSKQRDELMQSMAIDGGNVKVVEAYQRYNKWIMDRALLSANTWRYNMVQSPDLDPTVNAPISEFGLKLATEAQDGHQKEIFRLLSTDGMLLYFGREDCSFCHAMVPAVQALSKDTGIPVWHAPLDSRCDPAFGNHCQASGNIPIAQMLQVKQVPAVFLFVKPNTWIRVSTGVTQISVMQSRIAGFYAATRTAIIKGATSAIPGRAAVDFSDQLDGSGPKLPDAAAVRQSLELGR